MKCEPDTAKAWLTITAVYLRFRESALLVIALDTMHQQVAIAINAIIVHANSSDGELDILASRYEGDFLILTEFLSISHVTLKYWLYCLLHAVQLYCNRCV